MVLLWTDFSHLVSSRSHLLFSSLSNFSSSASVMNLNRIEISEEFSRICMCETYCYLVVFSRSVRQRSENSNLNQILIRHRKAYHQSRIPNFRSKSVSFSKEIHYQLITIILPASLEQFIAFNRNPLGLDSRTALHILSIYRKEVKLSLN